MEIRLTWSELYRLSRNTRAEQQVLDAALGSLETSRDASLHASVVAAVPTLEVLCSALDAHGVAPSRDVEAQVAMPFRLVDWPGDNNNQVAAA